MLRKNRKTFEQELNVDLSDVRVSFSPRSKRDIMRDLGMVERDGEIYMDGRLADRLRFFLVANADGTACETFWWNGYIATHAIMAPVLPLSVESADSGFVDIVKSEWKLYDTDSNGFFYPQYVRDLISKIIG